MPRKFATFDAWKDALTSYMEGTWSLGPDDIDDYDYATAYEQGDSPYATARAAFRAAKNACGL